MGNEEVRGGRSEEQIPRDENLTSPISEPQFTTNEALKRISSRFINRAFYPEKAMQRVQALMAERESDPQLADLVGFLAEAHVAYVLEEFSKTDPEIVLNPIKLPSETKTYMFKRVKGAGTVDVIRKVGPGGTVATVTDFDNLFRAGGLLTLVEVKSAPTADSKGKKNKYTLNYAQRQEVIEAKLDPLRELFPNDEKLGYIVVGSQEAIGESGKRKKAFAKKGIVLLPLPISLENLRSYAETLQERIVQSRRPQRAE